MESKGTDQGTLTASGYLFSTVLADPLSEVTRKERVYLLAISTIGIAIARTGLVPSRISALGIRFDQANQNSLLLMLGIVVAYFLVAFIIYAVADFFAWLEDYRTVVGEGQRLQEELNDKADARRKLAYHGLSTGTFDDQHTVGFYKSLSEDLVKDLRANAVGRRAEEMGLIKYEQTYYDDAPPILRVYVGEELKRKKARQRVMGIVVLRAAFEYVLPVLWGAYALFVLV